MIIHKESSKRSKTQSSEGYILKSKRILVSAIIFATVIVLFSGLYLNYAWRRYHDAASSEAIKLGQSLGALLPTVHVAELSGSDEDLNTLAYVMIKQNLTRLVATTNPIHFAYLLTEINENIIILVDSESPDSPDYSPPGQIYEEANDIYREPFRSGKTIITKPTTDRWGTWVSVLVPIKDVASGKIIAVFGLDYSASEWYTQLWRHMIPDIIIVICIITLSLALSFGLVQYFKVKRLNKKIASDEALYHSVFDQAPIGTAIVNDKRFIFQSEFGNMNINPMFERILGRRSSDLENIIWPEITHPEDLQTDLENFEQFKTGKINGYSMEKRFLKPDGSSVWTNMKISYLEGLNDNRSLHLCLLEDISERKQAELALKESERRHSVLLSHLPGLAYRCQYDPNWTMQFVSDGCYNLTGFTPDSLINNRDLSYNDLILPEYREPLWNEWERILACKQPFKFEYEITTATGERKWVLEMGQGIYSDDGEVEALEGIVLDISDRKQIEHNLRYINEHDGWTGLYNRDYLELLLKEDINKKDGLKRAVISINLSTVQLLTANYGFHYTQNLIKKAAELLIQYCTDKRMLFQTYENQFVFYVKDYKDKNELIEYSGDIASTLESLFVTDRISGGIGILEVDQGEEINLDFLLRRLLIASERAINMFEKDFRACFYDNELEALVNREGEIRKALSRIAADDNYGELFLEYQPILDLKTGLICSFEALARLKTEKLGLVSSMEFIPIAEKTKLIIRIGEKIIIDAFHFLNRLEERGYETINVSINVSAIQLLRPDFTVRLLEIIHHMHVNPANIGIEITESVFVNSFEDINNIIGRLRDAGLYIAIDDFGTGYSSLAREGELNVDCLKIDKYFIDRLLLVEHDKAITGDIISMAHKLGHCVIAEGVERDSQLQYLKEHGCDRIQGYLISKPLDEEAALEFLSKQGIIDNDYHI